MRSIPSPARIQMLSGVCHSSLAGRFPDPARTDNPGLFKERMPGILPARE